MNVVITITLSILLVSLLLVPFFIAVSLLFPGRLAKIQDNLGRIPGRCLGIGLVNFAFMVMIGLALFSLSERVGGVIKGLLLLLALGIGLLLAISLSLGLSGMANLLGERLVPGQSRWRQTLWGTLLLGGGTSVPLLGWFILLPYALWVGMGGAILAWLQRKPEQIRQG